MSTKHTTESLTAQTKAQVIEHTLSLQNQTAKEYRVIPAVPAVPAKEQYTDANGIIVPAVSEVPAVPAVSIRAQIEQLPEVAAYLAECAKVDEANKIAEADFVNNPKVKEIQTAIVNAEKFRSENAEKLAKIDELRKAIGDAMKAKGTIPTKIKTMNAEYMALDASIVYPADYDISYEPIPTYTPAPYADIDTACPSGCNGFPLSFLLGTKKSAKVASAKSESNGEKGTGGMADVTDAIKAEVNSIIDANLASGETAGKGLSKKFPNLSSSTLAILVRTHTK